MPHVAVPKQHAPISRWPIIALGVVLLGCGTARAEETGRAPAPPVGPPITLEKDDQAITASAVVKPGRYQVSDAAGDGAILITGDDLVVDFQGAELVGATDDQQPDAYSGKGLVLKGKNITLRNAKVRGYKVGIYAENCPGLVIEDTDISGNYRKHLLSNPAAEDGSDWIFPHKNNNDEWMNNYGAGLYVRSSDDITIRRVRARQGQNGMILDRVNGGKIYDNDCSFLSGWGLAMWRSNRNVISRNAFDFCVRGYSHGVYNRGQDSAGILMFEQNNDNVLAENSVTHGGDGFFGFGGEESIEGSGRTGCNGNLLIGNDFSYAPAHGIEMTFSFDNKFIKNRMVGNAICGVWGGYSQSTLIADNTFENNGEMGYGLERGGVNIEHGTKNVIVDNVFKNNKCGVHLWWDDDAALFDKPWLKANHKGSTDETIARNTFDGNDPAIHLRESKNVLIAANKFVGVAEADIPKHIVTTAGVSMERKDAYEGTWETPKFEVYGETRPVGARKNLEGRQNIVMTEWGPYDFVETAVFPAKISGGEKALVQVLGPSGNFEVTKVTGDVKVEPMTGALPAVLTVTAPGRGVHPFTVEVTAGGKQLNVEGSLLSAEWDVKFYQWDPAKDPRDNLEAWKELIAKDPVEQKQLGEIDFRWGGGAPSKKISPNYFGVVAETELDVPVGQYMLETVSDDGIRVWLDGDPVIDDWTWHVPTEHNTPLTLKQGKHKIRVEYFEIDGYAQLQVRLKPTK